MKHLIALTSLLFAVSLNAQTITKSDLIDTEWFVNNSDTIFDMYSINLKPGDTVRFIQRIHTDLMESSPEFRRQEFALFQHYDYANFEFEKKQLSYYVSSKDLAFHTIVGQMPTWTWKLKHKNEIYLYQSGKFELSLLLVETATTTFTLDGMETTARVLTFVKKK